MPTHPQYQVTLKPCGGCGKPTVVGHPDSVIVICQQCAESVRRLQEYAPAYQPIKTPAMPQTAKITSYSQRITFSGVYTVTARDAHEANLHLKDFIENVRGLHPILDQCQAVSFADTWVGGMHQVEQTVVNQEEEN